MSKKDEGSMIGYDPLAWMHEDKDQKQAVSLEQVSQAADAWVELDDESEIEAEQNAWLDSECLDADTGDLHAKSSDEIDSENRAATAQTQFIVLSSVQNVQTVSQLHAQLMQALGNGNKIDIDASAVTQIDTASLQLLLVLKQTAIKQQKQVSIDFPSEDFIEAAKLLGLTEALNIDQVASGLF